MKANSRKWVEAICDLDGYTLERRERADDFIKDQKVSHWDPKFNTGPMAEVLREDRQ
jgi:hypothetical protein